MNNGTPALSSMEIEAKRNYLHTPTLLHQVISTLPCHSSTQTDGTQQDRAGFQLAAPDTYKCPEDSPHLFTNEFPWHFYPFVITG